MVESCPRPEDANATSHVWVAVAICAGFFALSAAWLTMNYIRVFRRTRLAVMQRVVRVTPAGAPVEEILANVRRRTVTRDETLSFKVGQHWTSWAST